MSAVIGWMDGMGWDDYHAFMIHDHEGRRERENVYE